MSTPSPSTTEWVPAWQLQSQTGMPSPVVNGQWLKGVGDSVVWAPLSVPGTVYDTGWHYVGQAGEPAFQNSWQNYPDIGHEFARFRRTADNMVYIQGFIQRAGAAAPPNWSVIFQLPAGYIPGVPVQFDCVSVGGWVQDILIANDGIVYWHGGLASAAGQYMFLGGISYMAEY
jgi:hypothetical protein